MKLFAFIIVFALRAGAAECPQPVEIKVFEHGTNAHTVAWTFNQAPALYESGTTEYSLYTKYVNWHSSHGTWTPTEKLKQHLRVIERLLETISPDDGFYKELLKDREYVRRVLSGKMGRERNISCLELYPFIEHLKHNDLTTKQSEFMANVFEKNGWVVVIGDFKRGETSTGVAGSKKFEELFRTLINHGWKNYANIHNHPVAFDRLPEGDVGPIIPSGPDLETYRVQKPEFAWVTDGIFSFEMKQIEYK